CLLFSILSRSSFLLPSFPTRRSSDLDTARLCLDFVHHFHRLDNANHCFLRNGFSNINKGRGVRRCSAIECSHHGRNDFFQLYALDRKSTRLNSSHGSISYAVFCLKKK